MAEYKSCIDTVYIISPVNFERVQRHTERYYLTKFCSENYNTHVISPSSRIPNVSNHHFYFEGIFGILCLNVLFLPVWLLLFLKNKPDIVHCYPGAVIPQFVAQIVADAQIVFDIRSDPFEQREEFNTELDQEVSILKGYLYSIHRYLFHWAVNRADLVVTLSDDLARKLSQNYNIDYDLMHITPQGVDADKFEPKETRTDNDLNIVYIGTINGLRGLDTFFSALRLLDPQTQSKTGIDLIGGGDSQFIDDYLSTASESMPELTVNYHGYVEHDKVQDIAGQNNLAISPLPRLESYKVSSPAKVYEYLALGLPVIATDIPAHRRILTDNKDSILVSPESPEEIAAAIEGLLDDPDRVIEMGERARETALQNSWEDRFSHLFKEISRLP